MLVYDTSSKWKNQIKSYMALNSRQVYPKVLQRHLIHIPPEDGESLAGAYQQNMALPAFNWLLLN